MSNLTSLDCNRNSKLFISEVIVGHQVTYSKYRNLFNFMEEGEYGYPLYQ